MKKLLSFCIVILSVVEGSVSAFSQLVVVQTGFNNYVGTSVTAPAGWYMSWHSTSSPSFYTTATNYGIAAPSYKFGLDSVFVITPQFVQSDTVSFWCKGQSISASSKLNLYASSDSISWTMFASRDTLPTTGTILKFGIPSSAKWLMFVYRKIAGNLSFDDVTVTDYANISAAFTASMVCYGDSLCFVDQSVSNNGPIISWNWNFGDATSGPSNISLLQNPCHLFTSAGTYSVTLIVANVNGDTDTVVSPLTIFSNPTAAFASGVNGITVIFSDASIAGSGDPITSWNWNFPGGNPSSSTSLNPTITYSANGTYTACLTVVSQNGCTDSTCQTVTITSVGINDLNNLSSINIYPTISENGIFNLKMSQFENLKIKNADIYNAYGQKIYSAVNFQINQSSNFQIDISSHPAGIYFVKFFSEKGEATKKIIISRSVGDY